MPSAPQGLPLGAAPRAPFVEAAAASSRRRAVLPARSSAEILRTNDADHAIATRINKLLARLKIGLATVDNADDATKHKLSADAYKEAREAESLYAQLSPAAQHTGAATLHTVTLSTLTCVQHLTDSLTIEMDLYALQERQARSHRGFDDPGVAAYRANTAATLRQLQQWNAQLDDYMSTGFAVHRHPGRLGGTTPAEKQGRFEFLEGVLDRLLEAKVDLSHTVMVMNAARLYSYDLPDDLMQPIRRDVPRQVMEVYEAFNAMGQRRDPVERIELCKSGWNVLERLEHTLDCITETAAEKWTPEQSDAAEQEVGAERWQHALAFTDSLSSLVSVVSQRLELSTANARALIAWQDSQTQPAAQDLPWAVTPDKPQTSAEASGSTGRPRRHRSRPSRGPAQAAVATAAAAAPDTRQLALRRADRLLKSSPVTMTMASDFDADPLAIARHLRHDTTAIDVMALRGHDPLNVAHSIGESVRGWFGDISALHAARDEAIALTTTRTDAELQTRIAQLGERIEALERVHQRMVSNEADALKQHPFPKAKHLDRMLALGQIGTVGAPVNLPPAENEGALFELKILLRPLADGSPAAPLYLHLHSNEQAVGEQCLALPFEQFTAAHIKTEKQKNLGRHWEQTQRLTGNAEARVHRGRMEAPLWNSLKSIARAEASTAAPSPVL